MSDFVNYRYISNSRLTTGGHEIPATNIGKLSKEAIDKALKNKIIKKEKEKPKTE